MEHRAAAAGVRSRALLLLLSSCRSRGVAPGILDLGFLGMPGCQLRSSLDVLNAWVATGPTHVHGFFVPNNPAIIGVHVFTSGSVFTVPPITSFGAITSNGLDGLIGTH